MSKSIKISTLTMLNVRTFAFILSLILQSVTSSTFGQFSTINEQKGYWSDSLSWVRSYAPGTSILKNDVFCFGEITSLHCLDFNQSVLTIYDTLVINGNLIVQNNANLVVESDAVLIIYGDFTSKNKVDVQNKGTIIVAGNFEMLGSVSKGTFNNEGDLFIADTTPTIKDGFGFENISCTITDSDTVCGYQDFQALEKHDIFDYYSSYLFSCRQFADKKNDCESLKIVYSGTLCLNDTLTFFADLVGYDYSDTIKWSFDEGAYPGVAQGLGPHNVIYETSGEKIITLGTYGIGIESVQETIVMEDIPLSISIINDKDEIAPGLFLDEVCEGTIAEYRTNGSVESNYLWKVPSLSIDTITDYFFNIFWDLSPGEHQISVIEMNASGCLGQEVSEIVLVKDCMELNLFEKENFAFTPNDDHVNDVWEIPGIEKYPLAKIYIFNRDGEPIYKSSGNYQNDWDGTSNGSKLGIGSYYYVIDLAAYNIPEQRGVVTIIW